MKQRSVGHLGPRTRHTPGPWFQEIGGGDIEITDAPEVGGTLAWVNKDHPDSLGNAKLIEAAPTLLAACKANIAAFERVNESQPWLASEPKWWLEWSASVRELRAAVAAAEGGDEPESNGG